MCTVYVLPSRKDGHRYIGCTQDLPNRLRMHQAGQVKFTQARRPFDLVHTEEHPDGSSARKREDFLKTGQGRTWLDDQSI